MKAIKEFIRLNKKMFYIFCAIIGSFFLILIILLIMKLLKGTKITYSKLESKMVTAAEEYYADNSKTLPKVEGEEVSISLDKLVTEEYIKPLEKLVDATCNGTVTIKKNDKQYMYYPNLDCGSEYKTRLLSNVITDNSNVVTAGAGLYKYDSGYVFRGEYVNNYVSFAGSTWRILSIDNDGNIRMIKSEYEKNSSAWDDRYNSVIKRSYGINDYSVSRLRESLVESYDDYAENAKKHIIIQNVCAEHRTEDQFAIKSIGDCSSYENNQHFGVISIDDYSRASIDPNCTNVDSDSCTNYNYLYDFLEDTWTSTSYGGNTNQAFYSDTYVDYENCNIRKRVYITLQISGKEVYISGDGTEKNQYVIDKSSKS